MLSINKSHLPNFFIVGAAKAGTTSLTKYLAQHPNIFIPEIKEPKYFSHFDNVFPHNGPGDAQADSKVVTSLDDYCKLFQPGAHCKARGESSVDYLFFKKTSMRILNCVPNANIFIILRNPIDRAFSAYMHMVRDGRENLSFEDAIKVETKRKEANWEFFWRYTELGFYSHHVKRYLKEFGKDQVFVLFYDDFFSDPIMFCKNIFRILGVDKNFTPDISHKHNISGYPRMKTFHNLFNRRNKVKSFFKPFFPQGIRNFFQRNIKKINLKKGEMKRETREKLQSLYRDEIFTLEAMLDRSLEHWLKKTL